MRVSAQVKTPGFVSVVARIIHPYPRTRSDGSAGKIAVLDPQLGSIEIGAIQAFVDTHGHAQFARATRDIDIAGRRLSQLSHYRDVFKGFDGANQDGSGVSIGFSNSVQA